MKVLINAKNTDSVVCRVAKSSISNALKDNGFSIKYDQKDYSNFDLVLFFSPESNVDEVRKINKYAKIGILDPKLNNELQYEEARKADFLVVSSLEQKLFSQKFSKNIVIFNWFPNVNFQKIKNKKKSNKIKIAYQGNKIHLNSFNHSLKNAFENLYREFNHIELIAIYDIDKLGKWKIGRPNIPIFDVQWNVNNYCDILSSCDIGLVPNLLPVNKKICHSLTKVSLKNSNYNYNKNDYFIRFKQNSNPNRFWEFSQLKIPVVADLFPSSCQLINDEYNGLLAFDEETWFQSIKFLIENPQYRDLFGERLFQSMNNLFSVKLNQDRLINFLFSRFPKLMGKGYKNFNLSSLS